MTVRKEKNGTWTVDISNGVNPITGKRIRIVRKGMKSKKEAMMVEQHVRMVKLQEKRIGDKVTVDILFDLMMKEEKRIRRKISYLTTQENNYKRHIHNYFSGVDLNKLTYEHIYQFRESLKHKKKMQSGTTCLSNNTINKITILLSKLFEVGIRSELLNNNPVKKLKKLPVEKKEMNFWSIEEFAKFRELIKEDEKEYELFSLLAFFTGMREGEILALTWEDVSLRNKTIHVSKTMYSVHKTNYINSTKTKAGNRYISINSKLTELLKDWKEEQSKLLGKFSDDTNKLQVIQTTPITVTKNMIDKKFKQILKRDENLKKIRIHDLRHSHASLLINQGEDYLVVKERLGHASITTTIDTYSHLYPSKQKDLAEKLDDIF